MSNPQVFVLLTLVALLLLAFVYLFRRVLSHKPPLMPPEPHKWTEPGEAEEHKAGETDSGEMSPPWEDNESSEEEATMAKLRTQSKLYHYTARVTKVYDGDTITVDIDLGLGLWRHDQTIRLWKINTPEVRGPEREDGLRVRDFVRALILDRDILLRTILDKRGQDRTGKFGRLLGEVLVENGDGRLVNVNDLLLEKKMALPMGEDGSKMPTQAPAPAASPMPAAETGPCIPCRYCGEERDVLEAEGCIETCANCLDGRYRFQGQPPIN